MPSAKFFGILLALISAIIVSNTSNAATITFNEIGIGPGSLISDQYASQGLIFSANWSTSAAPGFTQGCGINWLQLNDSYAGLYLKFTVPIYSFAASVFEFNVPPSGGEPQPFPQPPDPPSAPIPPPPSGGDYPNLPPTGGEQPSVYAGLFRINNNVYQQMTLDQVTGKGNTEYAGNELVVHAEGTWKWLGFTSENPVDGLWIHNPDLGFYITNIYYNQTPAPVPVPSSLLLLVFGLIGLAAYGRKFKTA